MSYNNQTAIEHENYNRILLEKEKQAQEERLRHEREIVHVHHETVTYVNGGDDYR